MIIVLNNVLQTSYMYSNYEWDKDILAGRRRSPGAHSFVMSVMSLPAVPSTLPPSRHLDVLQLVKAFLDLRLMS